MLKSTWAFLQNGAIVDEEIYEKISEKFDDKFPDETKELQVIMVSKGALNKRKPRRGSICGGQICNN